MQIERKILGNATALGISAVIRQLTIFGFVILVARGFGRDVFAQYAFSMAVGAMACVLVTFGSISLLVKAGAQDKSRGLEMLTAVLPLQIIMGLVVWLVVIVLGYGSSMAIGTLSILAFIVGHHVIIQITAVLLSQLQGQERMGLVAGVQVGRNVFTLGLGVTLALTTGSAVAGVSAMPIASMVFLLYARAQVQNLLGPIPWIWNAKEALDVAIQAAPFLVIVVLATANERLGVLMLYFIQGSDAVATFASGERIVSAAAIVYTMLATATLPAAARLALSDANQHRELVNKVARLVNLATIPGASILFLFSDEVIAVLFGGEFVSSAPVLQTLASLLVIRAVSTIQEMAAISTGRQRVVVIGRIVGLVLLFVLGVVLIQLAGPLGLAYAMLGAELAYATTLYVLLHRADVSTSPLNASLRVAAACAISIAVGVFFADASPLVQLMLVLGTMAAALWGFGAVSPRDLKYLRAIFNTKRSDVPE